MSSFHQRGSSDSGCLILVVLFGLSFLCFVLAEKFWRYEDFLIATSAISFLLGVLVIFLDEKSR